LRIPLCVDTYKAEVADAALRAGAKMLNDITALKAEPAIGEIAAQHGAPVVLMHIKGEPRTMQNNPSYDNLMSEIIKELRNSISKALACGIPRNKIIIDPGIGFGKKYEHNLTLINRSHQLKSLGYPLLFGVSRKSFIGAVTGKTSPAERLFGTLGACAAAVIGGASILRVHDPQEVRETAMVTKAIITEHLNVAS
ncbi:MAG: dihydropteroate synthase, partial [Planctomycetota bacterium]|nr:dihydropteroate synthase [Planctomycetota bacterium]